MEIIMIWTELNLIQSQLGKHSNMGVILMACLYSEKSTQTYQSILIESTLYSGSSKPNPETPELKELFLFRI